MLVLSALPKLLAQVLSPPSQAPSRPSASGTSTPSSGTQTLVNPILYANGGSGAGIHTAVLFTPSGALVAFAALPSRGKDSVRVLVGLAVEVWSETRFDEHDGSSEAGEIPHNGAGGMVESQIGRVVVRPIAARGDAKATKDPVLLLALNADNWIEWGELQLKADSLATHLAKPLGELQEKFSMPLPAASSKVGRR